MVESIADVEGCDGKWICLKCKTRHASRITVNEPWMRYCQKYYTVLQGDQCGGTFCPGTRTGGAWFWKCKGICSHKKWNADGSEGGTLSRSNYNSASRKNCPFFLGIHGYDGCAVTLGGKPTASDNVAAILLNTHPGYLKKEYWWFFCHCTQPEWTFKSAGTCSKCHIHKQHAESMAREDGTLGNFYFK